MGRKRESKRASKRKRERERVRERERTRESRRERKNERERQEEREKEKEREREREDLQILICVEATAGGDLARDCIVKETVVLERLSCGVGFVQR